MGHRKDPIRTRTINPPERSPDWALLLRKDRDMRRIAAALCLCWLLLPTPQAAAQQPHVESLATLFEDVYGPNGLVLNSDDVQLDGTNHAAHFNSAFQSDFRLVNIALTSQLTARAAAIAGIRVHLQVRFRNRHVRALDEQLRSDPFRSRRDNRPRSPRVRVLSPVLLVRSSRWCPTHSRAGSLPSRRLSKPAAAAPTSSRR